MRRIVIAAAVLLFALCLLGAAAPVDGTYTLFTAEMMGEQKPPESLGLAGSSLRLSADGTGVFTLYGMEQKIAHWTEEDGTLTLYNESGVPIELALSDGIVELDMGTGAWLYFAREGIDTAGFVMQGHAPDSRLFKVFHAIDARGGAHLNYEYHSDYLDSTSGFDVHEKDGKLFSLRTTAAGGYRQLSASAFLDGTSYVLYPDEMRGNVALSSSLSMVRDNILLTDDLYKSLFQRAMRTDYRTETREVDGVSYTVDVYPAVDYTAEAAYYFDGEGKLTHVLEGAPVIAPQLGETFYTVHAVDTAVDETLFDLSGYTIEG